MAFSFVSVLSAPSCRAPGGGFDPSAMDLSLQAINDSRAVCQDGSPAKLYYRPCCDGTAPGDHCNTTDAPKWFIVFGDGNTDGWCWDATTCATRERETPRLTGSKNLPQYFSRNSGTCDSRVGCVVTCRVGFLSFLDAVCAVPSQSLARAIPTSTAPLLCMCHTAHPTSLQALNFLDVCPFSHFLVALSGIQCGPPDCWLRRRAQAIRPAPSHRSFAGV